MEDDIERENDQANAAITGNPREIPTMSLLEVRGLAKQFKKRQVVNSVSISGIAWGNCWIARAERGRENHNV